MDHDWQRYCAKFRLTSYRLNYKTTSSCNRPRFKPTPFRSLTRPQLSSLSIMLAAVRMDLLLTLSIPLLILPLVISNTNCDQIQLRTSESWSRQWNQIGLHSDSAYEATGDNNVGRTKPIERLPNEQNYEHHHLNLNHNRHHWGHDRRDERVLHANKRKQKFHFEPANRQQDWPAVRHHHHDHRPLSMFDAKPGSQQALDRMKRHQPVASGGDSSRYQQLDSQTMKVAALASKLEHWLQCQRFALTGNRPVADSSNVGTHHSSSSSSNNNSNDNNNNNNSNNQQQQRENPRDDTVCAAHFDGHLCWPPARVGQQIQLACPKLSWLPRKSNGNNRDATNSNQPDGQQEKFPQPPKQLQIQVAKSRMNSIQQPQPSVEPAPVSGPMRVKVMTTQDGERVSASSGDDSATIRTAANDHGDQDLGLQFAWRRCEPNSWLDFETTTTGQPLNGSNPLRGAKWQDKPDYSQCQAQSASGNQLQDPTDEWIKLDEPSDKELFANLAEGLERIEANIDPYADPDIQEQWSICIGEIMHQQQDELTSVRDELANNNNSSDQHCPIIFDGWRCWPRTRAGEVAYVSCPSNQPGFSAERKAHKICTSEADWYRHPMTNRYWSNYTTCVDTVDLAFRTKILNLYVIGNLISLIALTASLIIFISFKNLNCTRVTIHKNLFLSFIINNFMWIIWYTYVVNDAGLLQANPIECQFWHILLHYFLVSNYFWMFCEGLYLHTLLVVAFVSEDKILKWFYLLGWLTPVPITLYYAYNRSYDEYYTNFCWMEESPHNIILMAPIGFSLLLNLVFLVNIVRVLVTKLRANNSPDTHQTRKAVRATLILIPLLGLHYMLTPFRPEAKSEWEVIYEIVAAVCTSFQGLCVAMLFCFFNGEVISVIKKKLKDTFRSREPMRGRSGTKSGSLAFLANNDHHPASKCHRLETSHTLRSIVSSSSHGDIARGNSIQANSIGGLGPSAYKLIDQSTALIDAGTTSFNIVSNGSNSVNNDNNILIANNNNDIFSKNNNNSKNGLIGNSIHSNSVTSTLLTNVTASPISYHRNEIINFDNQHQQSACETISQETEVVMLGDGNCLMASTRTNEEAIKLL